MHRMRQESGCGPRKSKQERQGEAAGYWCSMMHGVELQGVDENNNVVKANTHHDEG